MLTLCEPDISRLALLIVLCSAVNLLCTTNSIIVLEYTSILISLACSIHNDSYNRIDPKTRYRLDNNQRRLISKLHEKWIKVDNVTTLIYNSNKNDVEESFKLSRNLMKSRLAPTNMSTSKLGMYIKMSAAPKLAVCLGSAPSHINRAELASWPYKQIYFNLAHFMKAKEDLIKMPLTVNTVIS